MYEQTDLLNISLKLGQKENERAENTRTTNLA